MSVHRVVDTQIQFLGMGGLELEMDAQIHPYIGRHFVVIHRSKVIQGEGLSEEGDCWIFPRSDGLPMAGLKSKMSRKRNVQSFAVGN